MLMVETGYNVELNRLLIDLARSLLQYIGESWPWIPAASATHPRQINELVARQQAQVARLAELLAERDWPVDFGTYPTDYTNLHYVALEYLLSRLVENETALVADIEWTIQSCAGDAEAVGLLEEILAEERDIVAELQELKKPRETGSAV